MIVAEHTQNVVQISPDDNPVSIRFDNVFVIAGVDAETQNWLGNYISSLGRGESGCWIERDFQNEAQLLRGESPTGSKRRHRVWLQWEQVSSSYAGNE